MTAPVSLAEAKLFLRVGHEAEDGLIQTLVDAARARVEGEVGYGLTSTSAAPLRLAILMLAMRAYPAVEAYRALAAECRDIAGPGVQLAYAADWSEYSGHRPDDGSGDVIFHLDPLWADPNVDLVGVDWYPPMGDWREGDGGLDGEVCAGPPDPGYLASQVAGGEDFDWFYADAADRAAQVRTPITDGAYGEPWVHRAKDLRGWWSNSHHARRPGAPDLRAGAGGGRTRRGTGPDPARPPGDTGQRRVAGGG